MTSRDTMAGLLRRLPARSRLPLGCGAVLALGLPFAHALGYATPPYVVVLGAIIGIGYGLLGVCLVLVFRTSRVINFALPQIGIFAAASLPVFVQVAGLPYWPAFALSAVVGFAASALVNLGVVRRLAKAPRGMVTAATIGAGVLLSDGAGQLLQFTYDAGGNLREPTLPAGLPQFSIGPLLVTQSYTGLLVIGPLLVAALTVFLTRSRYGVAIRAVACNPDAARMAGISEVRMSTLAWGIAGSIAAVTTILTAAPSANGNTTAPVLLLPALGAAVVGAMQNLSRAMAAGIFLGMVQQVVLWKDPSSHAAEVVVFVVLLVALMMQPRTGGRTEAKGSWVGVAAMPPLPPDLARLWPVRHGPKLVLLAVAGAVIGFGLTSGAQAVNVTVILSGAMVAASAGILTSLAGELTLGQYAVAGVGGVASYYVVEHTASFPLGLLAAAAAAGACALVLGLPALRTRGLMVTVTTLGFAMLASDVILPHSWLLGDGVTPAQPIVAGHTLSAGQPYLWYAALVFCLVLLLAHNVWRGGFGRLLRAVRDNESAARTFTVRPTRVRIQAFVVAGLLAGLGGAVYAHFQLTLDAATFPPELSVGVALALIVGGLSSFSGALIGSLWVIGAPLLLPSSGLASTATTTGVLVVALCLPGGLVSLLRPVRDWTAGRIGRMYGIPLATAPARRHTEQTDDGQRTALSERPPASRRPQPPVLRRPDVADRVPGQVLLRADGLVKSFGGVSAVQGVTLDVVEGETLGLIGPNGAGKTTTFEMLSGFVVPDGGTVHFAGSDVTGLAPEQRARRGLIRSFQDSSLFPTMTVREVLALTLERQHQTPVTASVLGMDRTARRRQAVADELIDYFGLGDYRGRTIHELSTGTRRITELACMMSLRPRLLLLDEPSAGIAQRETEALGVMLRNLKKDFDFTLVVIEHDIPLVMALADRIAVMVDGQVMCCGTGPEIRADQRVADAYLGGSVTAIERSEHTLPTSSTTS
ncbi:branched-chain amino acid ABC transporter permease/ATP-binding protein [Streptomyces sp. NPDC007162]|uniref:branched-chain amino acid ABC transporter permease/ATP-binding protein n=1 Tax=Streptomyces sp. NPDC007162 TaxID=3156917 RepID=UPI0034047AA2